MSGIHNLSRRDFLKNTGITGAMVLGAQVAPSSLIAAAKAQSGASIQPNLFVSIADDGVVTITCSRSEMGQGVRTGIPMILADELEADWQRVKIWQAPGDAEKYDPAGKDGQNTDGSRSTRHHLDVMRELGAAGRYVLEQAAARKWGVDPGEVYAKDHRLHHTGSGRSFDFGEVVDAAADIAVPTGADAPKLKDPSQWKYIGRDMPVVDNYDMSTGGADFGADVSIPGMKIAVVARAPVYRGKVKSFDATEALGVQGVEQVVEIPALPDDKPAEFRALGGIAVIGTNTWSVLEGRRKLAIEWDDGPNTAHDSSTYDDTLRAAAREGGHVIRDRGNVDEAFAAADRVLEAEYFVPYFIHTPMEPPAAIVDANARPVRIITSTQSPNETRQYVAEALGVEKSEVECQVTLLGGGFGRKSKPDFACEAAILSQMVGAPVRVQWTREDEIRNGYYHAASAHRMKAGLDASGKVTAWHHSGAWPSLIGLWAPAIRTGHPIEYGLGTHRYAIRRGPEPAHRERRGGRDDPGGLVPLGEQHPARLRDELLRVRARGGGGTRPGRVPPRDDRRRGRHGSRQGRGRGPLELRRLGRGMADHAGAPLERASGGGGEVGIRQGDAGRTRPRARLPPQLPQLRGDRGARGGPR